MPFQDKSDYFDAEHDDTISYSTSAQTANEPYETSQPSGIPVQEHGDHTPNQTRHRFRNFMIWLLVFTIVAGAIAFYIRYYNPYAIDARESGIIMNVEKRGILFKTYEADVATQTSLHDTSTQYSRQNFSFTNDSLAHIAQQFQQSGQTVELTYSRYFATLPWRGASVRVITDIKPYSPIHNPSENSIVF